MHHLTRTDDARNMRRFYTLALQPGLFGGCDLVREWGRIGSPGTQHAGHYTTDQDAATALDTAIARKLKRGYVHTAPAEVPLLPVVSSPQIDAARAPAQTRSVRAPALHQRALRVSSCLGQL